MYNWGEGLMSDMLQKLDYSFSGHGQPVAPNHFLSPAMLS